MGNARIYEAEVPLFTMLRVGETELVLEPQGGDSAAASAYQGIIGNDPSVRQLAELIERVAPVDGRGADLRRDGHRQGAGRARGAPRAVAAREQPVRRRQLRAPSRRS